MGINALSSVQANDSWLGLQSGGDAVTEIQRLLRGAAVWRRPRALLQTSSHAVGLPGAARAALQRSKGSGMLQRRINQPPVITHRQSGTEGNCFLIAQQTIYFLQILG